MSWDRTIIQRNGDVEKFVPNFLGRADRRCALIAGAGFDPRTLAFPKLLNGLPKAQLEVLCLREERPRPQPHLRKVADAHAAALQGLFPGHCTVQAVEIFDSGGGVVGGRRVLPIVDTFLKQADQQRPLTDVLVDISALSCGIFFPIVAHILELINTQYPKWNLHLFVAENANIDLLIRGESVDTVSHIHGFLSSASLSQSSEHALLWAPVLSEDNEAQMRRIYDLINQPAAAVDIMPIVPFPGVNPRRPDVLVEHYRTLIGDWEIDPRHFLYAAESDPLDSYRLICQIDDLRARTYGPLGGSSTVLSPLGSKMLSVGLLLAAIEKTLRVVYVENLGYEELAVPVNSPAATPPLPVTHLWLAGEIYGAKH